MLKILWDYVYLVRSSIEDWKTTPWESINVEQMDMDCKKFAKVYITACCILILLLQHLIEQ